MSPRPKATTDQAILDATHRAVTRIGPMRLTLAHVAREAGVSPATLVQRFGSKRALLLALILTVLPFLGLSPDDGPLIIGVLLLLGIVLFQAGDLKELVKRNYKRARRLVTKNRPPKVAELPTPISSPWSMANCQRVAAEAAVTNPSASAIEPSTTGTMTPKRSASRPMTMPLTPNEL